MTILSNMRLLGLYSKVEGQDWAKLVTEIDSELEALGYDLAEETVVLEFEGDRVRVMRPVIGGVKELPSPWILVDRSGGDFKGKVLEGQTWDEILDQISESKFTLLLRRRIHRELETSVEVVFSFF